MVDVSLLMSNLQIYGYSLMFILMYIEGPIVTFVSSFLSSFGLFNIFIVCCLAFMGDFLSDMMHFFIGKRGFAYVERRLKKEGVTSRSISQIREMMRTNLFRALFLVKISPPPISSGGLFLAGTLKKKRKTVILYSALITLCIVSCFALLGFFIGSYFYSVIDYFDEVEIIVAAVVTIIIVFFVGKRLLGSISEKAIEKA